MCVQEDVRDRVGRGPSHRHFGKTSKWVGLPAEEQASIRIGPAADNSLPRGGAWWRPPRRTRPEERARVALEARCRAHRYLLYVFVRSRGSPAADAHDLPQALRRCAFHR